jgi:hypothetical protein
MLYETARDILRSSPRPRVRITLKTGDVFETPRPLLASVSPHSCTVSLDGIKLKFLRWDEIANFERVDTPASI